MSCVRSTTFAAGLIDRITPFITATYGDARPKSVVSVMSGDMSGVLVRQQTPHPPPMLRIVRRPLPSGERWKHCAPLERDEAPGLTSPRWGEVAAQRRVRGLSSTRSYTFLLFNSGRPNTGSRSVNGPSEVSRVRHRVYI